MDAREPSRRSFFPIIRSHRLRLILDAKTASYRFDGSKRRIVWQPLVPFGTGIGLEG